MLRWFPTLAFAFLVTAPAAHDEDPKILDLKPRYEGPGYRRGWVRDPQNPTGESTLQNPPLQFISDGVLLQSWIALPEFSSNPSRANDCWGYVSGSGREYALMGIGNGTAIVEVTTPAAAVEVDFISGPDSVWRDIKVYQNYAYSVSEGGSGIQVINLANIDSGNASLVNTVTSGGTQKSHNVAIDEDSGWLYRCGGNDHGLRFYNLANPQSPQYAGAWNDRYVHDAQVVTYTTGPFAGRQIAYCYGGLNGGVIDPGLDIVDVTNKNNPIFLDHLVYFGASYSHQGWLDENQQYLYLDDELDETGHHNTRTFVFDVSDPGNPISMGYFANGIDAIGHNLYPHDGLLYEANYTSGLRVFDIAEDPVSPAEVAWFDTHPEVDESEFNGMWSTYPFLPSGTVLCSDIERGLFVLTLGEPPVSISHAGIPTVLTPDTPTEVAIDIDELIGGTQVGGTELLHYDTGSGFVSVPMQSAGAGSYSASLPALECGEEVSWFVSVETTDGAVWRSPNTAPSEPLVSQAAQEHILVTDQTFETTAADGWELGFDDVTSGSWVAMAPVGTAAAPDSDVTPGASAICYMTGNINSSQAGDPGVNDVDNGTTELLSAIYDLEGASTVPISYWRWYSNDVGGAVDDTFYVDVTNDGGDNWVNVETIGPGHPDASGGWVRHSFELADYVLPTAEVRLRFVASDLGAGSIVEAALDDVRIDRFVCADCNGNRLSDDFEIDQGLVVDGNQDGVPDDCDLFSVDTSTISTSQGGIQNMFVTPGAGEAGQAYWILGSLTGTSPGLPIAPGVVLPLVPDGYFGLTISEAGNAPFVNFIGTLDAGGNATATLTIGPGLPASLVGVKAYHAYLLADPGFVAFHDASPFVGVQLVD